MKKVTLIKKSKIFCLYLLLLISFYCYQGCGGNGRNPLATDVPAVVSFDLGTAVAELLAANPTETGINSVDIYYTESTGVADRPVSLSPVSVAATAVSWTLAGTSYPPSWIVSVSLPSGKTITLKFIFNGNVNKYTTTITHSFTAGSSSITVSSKGGTGFTITLPKANTAPVISSISSTYSTLPASGATTTTTLTCNATDADNDSLSYTWSLSGFTTGISLSSSTSNPTTLTAVPTGGASGTITVTCSATDLAATATATKNISVSGSSAITMPAWW